MLEKLLKQKFPELRLFTNRPYSELTSFGVGSAPVPLLAEPETQEMLGELLKFLHRKNLPVFILGAGTNIVGSDTPFTGVMIRATGNCFARISVEGNTIISGSYTKLPMLCSAAAKAGLCAAIYTQVSDVEDETNGLLSYDRKVEKLTIDQMTPIAAALQKAVMER